MARALINVPAKAKRGEIIEIKTLVSHPMESGYRVGFNGSLIPRDIIDRFVCTYNGEEIFRAELAGPRPRVGCLLPAFDASAICEQPRRRHPGRRTALRLRAHGPRDPCHAG